MHTALTENLDKYIDTLQRMQQATKGGRSKHPLGHKRHLKTLALKSSAEFLLHCAVRRAFRRLIAQLVEPSFVISIVVPVGWKLGDVAETAGAVLNDTSVNFCKHPSSKGRRGWDIEPAEYLAFRKLIIFSHEGSTLHEDFELAISANDEITPCDVRHLSALARLRGCGELSLDDAALLREEPSSRIEAIFRIGQPARRAISRLSTTTRPKSAETPPKKLDITKGFGRASIWAVDLMRDLREWRAGRLAWEEVDKGCLFFGPTGTGKTKFTSALADACDVHLESASMARWQSSGDGHLGDMLKAMYKSFAAAKENAPSILFIDECDSVGDRSKFPNRHSDYSTQVVNALLECLDGVDGREGVIVIGACNHPQKIDPALLRGGRLETHILFPRPDARGRREILEFHLPQLADDPALAEIAARLPEKSGADLERLSRDVRRSARKENRAVTIEDLRSMIAPLPKLDDGNQLHVAVHEAGHALVAHALKVGSVRRVEIFDNATSFATELDAHGLTAIEFPERPFETRWQKLKLIAMHLAGAAAEEVCFKDRSTMSSGYEESDFAKATLLAIEMVTRYGFGSTPYFLPHSVDENSPSSLWSDDRLAEEVEEILHNEYIRARDMLDGLQKPLMRFAIELVKHKRLEGKQLDKLWPGSSAPDKRHRLNG